MVAWNDGRVRGRTTEGKGGFKPKGHSQSMGYHRKCHYCDKEGHVIRDCSEDAVVIENSTDSEDNVLNISSGDWILNFGCFFHMCGQKVFFRMRQLTEILFRWPTIG